MQMSNCLFEALIQETKKACNCTPDAVGFTLEGQSCYGGQKLNCQKRIFGKYFQTLCRTQNYQKVSFVEKLGQYRQINDTKQNQSFVECMAACETQTYSTLVTSSRYPSEESFEYTEEFCFLVIKLLKVFANRGKPMAEKFPQLINLLQKLEV